MCRAALIFDFDGVVADSERLANAVLAEAVSALGRPTTVDAAIDRYMGRRWDDLAAAIAEDVGQPLPPGFAATLQEATLARFRSDLVEVAGAGAFIRRFAQVPQCIASSSSTERLRTCLDILGLLAHFGNRVYSADMVARGKPHPDIFLLAAEKLGMPPAGCVVIEDSPGGVRAARAAGMTVIGLCAAGHVRAGHADALTAAGADYTAGSWPDVAKIIAASKQPPLAALR